MCECEVECLLNVHSFHFLSLSLLPLSSNSFCSLSLPLLSHAHAACHIVKSNAIHSRSEYELDKCPTLVVVVHVPVYTYMHIYRNDDVIV